MKRLFAIVAVLVVLAMMFSVVSTLSAQKSEPPKTTAHEPVKDAPKVSLQITSVTSPVRSGEQATLNAQTAAGAVCKISVYYYSVRSDLESLGEKTAEASGKVTWTWKTGNDLPAGTYRIEVTSTLNETRVSQTTNFTVTK